ncbi:MAG TPA: multicopper oxidase domain-containing protein, partial [Acidimicrobiia bacterium]|nr:multicopper oxidase domain-containing protein [Acidimicrobiia bacterium]
MKRMPLLTRKDREVVGAANTVFALLAAFLAFAALVTAAHANSKSGGGGGSGGGGVQVTLTEFSISPASIGAPENGKVTVTNNGSAAHNFNIEGTDKKTKDLNPGESATLDLNGLAKGSYTVFCAISGHRQAGMQGTLVIGGTGASSNSPTGMANMDFNALSPEQLQAMNDQMDTTMNNAVLAYVDQLKNGPNTKGVGNQPLKPTVLADGTKEFHITAELANWEVQKDKPAVRAWTFNGTVPGPWIKVNVGDKVKVVVTNKLPMSTGVHFHGVQLPFEMDGVPDVTQPPIKPGATFTYSFTPREPM